MLKQVLIALIVMYQKTLSPDHGLFRARFPQGFCRFHPTCSEYTKQSILKFGAIHGTWLGLKRVIRCNPFIEPGIDQIPNHK